jgi:hypothetical protein
MTAERAHVLLASTRPPRRPFRWTSTPPPTPLGLQGQFLVPAVSTRSAPTPGNREIAYRIKNVSGQPDALIRLWQRPLLKRQQHDLDALAAALPSRSPESHAQVNEAVRHRLGPTANGGSSASLQPNASLLVDAVQAAMINGSVA